MKRTNTLYGWNHNHGKRFHEIPPARMKRVMTFCGIMLIGALVLRAGFGLDFVRANRMQILWCVGALWVLFAGYDALDELQQGNGCMVVALVIVGVVALGLALPFVESGELALESIANVLLFLPSLTLFIPINRKNAYWSIPVKLIAIAGYAFVAAKFISIL